MAEKDIFDKNITDDLKGKGKVPSRGSILAQFYKTGQNKLQIEAAKNKIEQQQR